jgi:hypothetical protein
MMIFYVLAHIGLALLPFLMILKITKYAWPKAWEEISDSFKAGDQGVAIVFIVGIFIVGVLAFLGPVIDVTVIILILFLTIPGTGHPGWYWMSDDRKNDKDDKE